MESLGHYGGGQATQPYRGGNGGAINGPMVDESASRIRDAVSMTEELIGQLHSTIDRVEKRLDTVLTPTPPQPGDLANTNKVPQQVSSHLLGRVGTQNAQIQHAIERLNRLAQRVEI